jgi:hypothetical protein
VDRVYDENEDGDIWLPPMERLREDSRPGEVTPGNDGANCSVCPAVTRPLQCAAE